MPGRRSWGIWRGMQTIFTELTLIRSRIESSFLVCILFWARFIAVKIVFTSYFTIWVSTSDSVFSLFLRIFGIGSASCIYSVEVFIIWCQFFYFTFLVDLLNRTFKLYFFIYFFVVFDGDEKISMLHEIILGPKTIKKNPEFPKCSWTYIFTPTWQWQLN